LSVQFYFIPSQKIKSREMNRINSIHSDPLRSRSKSTRRNPVEKSWKNKSNIQHFTKIFNNYDKGQTPLPSFCTLSKFLLYYFQESLSKAYRTALQQAPQSTESTRFDRD
ncbi:hypothetical protein PVAND_017695, partial [Polypedilum vanderplanki]